MSTPFSWLTAELQGNVLIALCVASLALMKILSMIGAELTIRSEHIPFGIISLEFSRSSEKAASIVKVWSDQGLIGKAVEQTRLDFLLLLLYPAALSLACTMVAGSGEDVTATIGIVFSWAVLLCTPLDAFENFMLLKMLSGFCNTPIPQLTTISASLKFTLFASSVIYMLSMLVLKG
jgi:hypothetical protein